MLSSSSLALLDRWLGSEGPGLGTMPSTIGPVIRKVADPVAPAALAVELLDDALHGRAQRRRPKGDGEGPGLTKDGKLTIDGRECCGELFTEITRMLPFIAIPGDFTCRCGTSYRVEMRTREDRHA